MLVPERHSDGISSLSARRAWIEIQGFNEVVQQLWVALRKESVDRNLDIDYCKTREHVALRKESVDRNA